MSGHTHDHGEAASETQWTAEHWDARYADDPAIWSGRVNPAVAAETVGLEPGRALEVGCGKGADALWLAEHGWQVVATDVSAVGLELAAGAAAEAGPEVAGRITWEQHDLLSWVPPTRAFHLVTASYFHLPVAHRARVFAGLAEAVVRGGSLVVVLHDVTHPVPGQHHPTEPGMFPTVAELVAELPDGWEVVTAESRPRPGHHPAAGDGVELTDVVLRARRVG